MEVNYEIVLNDYWKANEVYFEAPPKPTITYLNGFEVEISWNAPRNSNLLDYYYLFSSPTTVTMFENEKIYDLNGRTQRRQVAFGQSQYFGVLYAPRIDNYLYPSNLIRGVAEFFLGESLPFYSYILQTDDISSVLMSYEGKLYKYNLLSDAYTDSLQIDFDYVDYFAVSEDGRYLGYDENGQFICRKTSDFSLVYELPSINSGGLYMYGISNNLRLCTSFSNKTITVYDLLNEKRIAEKKFEGFDWVIAYISPDGNYILTKEYDNRVHIVYYEIINGELTEIGRIDESELRYGANISNSFGPENGVYVVFPEKVEIRNLDDFAIKREMQLRSLRDLDFKNMLAIGSDPGFSGSTVKYLYDLQSGEIIKTLYVRFNDRMYFYNNFLFNHNGWKLNLNTIN